MSDKVIVLASFHSEVEAQLARNRLEEAGIPTTLEGSAATTVFTGAGAYNRVNILVREEDAERALEILQSELDEPEEPETGIQLEPNPEGEDIEDEIDPQSPGYLASRAIRSAIIGFLFFPLFFYALYLVIKAMTRDKEPTDADRRQIWIALSLITLAVLWTVAWMTATFRYLG